MEDLNTDAEQEDGTDIIGNINVTAPRGDLVREIKTLVTEQSRPQIVGVTDPLSDTTALVAMTRDGEGNESYEAVPAKTFDDYLDAPRYRRGTATLTSIGSLVAHVLRFKDEASAIFVCDDRTKPSITAVLDYSPANVAGEDGIMSARPRFGRHRSVYTFPFSDEWTAWNKSNATPMDVGDFAAFLEDRIADVAAPGEMPLSKDSEVYIDRIGGRERIATPTDLVALSKGLRINENAAITDERKLASGEANLSFSTEHTGADGAPLRIPTSFILGIPVFRNDGVYGVVARLRYRPRPSLTFWYELHAIDRVFDHALTTAADYVGEKTGLPVLFGSPEA